MPYDLVWDEQAKTELGALTAFERRAVVDAVERHLRHQPNVETRNRKPLREPLGDLPDESWELRVWGDFRVLYWITGRRVVVLRVILKGTQALAEIMRRRHES